jgi:hypothetical protein
MESEIVESVQHAITPAECVDLYYPGKENTDIQCFPTTVENRFRTDLPSLNFGATNTLIFNPTEGLGDIALTLVLPAPVVGGADYDGWALSRGWGSQFINQVGIRIGGSSLYYFTGDQLEIQNFMDCEDSGKKDALWALAGSEILNSVSFADLQARTATVYIKCPWNSISALQKRLPLPTDLLTQPVQIQITFNRAADVFYPNIGASATALPSAFTSASVQYKQTHMADSSKLLARRVNMNDSALTYPLKEFQQTTFRTTVGGVTAGSDVQINLTGFRSGSVKSIDVWAIQVKDDDGAAVNVGNARNYSQILKARLSVNGLVYYDSDDYSYQMWNLCDMKTPGKFDTTVLTLDLSSGAVVAVPSVAPFVHIPFAQVSQALANNSDVTLGLPIANSVVNMTLQFPESGTYLISASYNYVSSLMFSKGSCEYVF